MNKIKNKKDSGSIDEKTNLLLPQRLQCKNRTILQKAKCLSNFQISQYNKEISNDSKKETEERR